ncbi:MAG: hypothetical protein QNJ98_04220, partial [Planctomycetota bacterium]|nr:hypothetical protein [Planctomycetota bacterium]
TVLPLADGVSAAEFERELAAHAPTFGFSKAKRIAHRGVTYVRMGVEWKTRDLQHLRPAWAVVERCLVLSSYEPALIAALDALRAPAEHAPVSKRPEVVAARSSAPAGLRRVLFADLALLCAVPPDQEPGRGPRGWHWDRRRLWVQGRYDVREMAMAERSKLLVKHREENERELTREDEETIERAIDAFVEAEQARFPERLEAYRLRLAKLSALRSLTLVQSNVNGGVRTDVTVRRED